DRLRAAGCHFGIRKCCLDPSELLSPDVVDGVIIATPHRTHYGLARAAVEAGIHTFVEKPMTLASSEAWELAGLAETRGVHLSVGYTAQYTPAASALREWFAAGVLGELIGYASIVATTVEPLLAGQGGDLGEHYGFVVAEPKVDTYSDPAQAGGGMVQTQLTHTIGMILYVTALHVVEVCAYTSSCGLAIDVADAIILKMSDGSIGTISATGTVTAGQKETHEVRYFGRAGTAIHDLLMGSVDFVGTDGRELHARPTEHAQPLPNEEPARAFVELIAGRGVNYAPAVPAAHTVSTIEAIYRSAESGDPAIPAGPP
ncbi:MAG TPA: Gfo/Idh/MocA family oxidoreductase, partial [Chloroflexota bacterium]|nr:Gfo/Idh/MocA family oxidoreductase [Chloroflexota bacterium]